ncbi:MAG TPA: 30S ribosomal protein S6 [Planctomycetota bacterium]|nr:30S ribosomal protein S6 [Planctomycetota bacterium]
MKLYEAMFVVDSNRARQDHAKVIEELRAVIEKGGGQVVNCDRWDERKLAYPIAKRRRGTYYLAHFNAEGDSIVKVQRAAELSETSLRVLITVDEDGEAFPVFAVEPEEEGFGHGDREGRDRDGGRDRDRGDRPDRGGFRENRPPRDGMARPMAAGGAGAPAQ